ncbi:hypothetical protein [Cellulomonas sp. PhB143]|uniref:hypothetical protein n=1 Tax=Cellulomonas sp. PhB143 TaxID=2485186 RepID=UPI0011CDEF4B|nr:hypothetical protein [Cellulomonas sp. PhB143]
MRRPADRRTARLGRTATLVVGAAALSLLAGCAPNETDAFYAPSDGLDTRDLGDVRGVNLLVLSSGEGDAGSLHGAFTNDGGSTVQIQVSPEGGSPVTVPVDAGDTVYLGTQDGEDATFASVDVAPGGLLPLTITAGEATEDISVPVLDGTLPAYSDSVPSTGPSAG